MPVKGLLFAALATLSVAANSAETRQFNVMAINDIYNIEGIDAGKSGSMARLRVLREQLGRPGEPALLLHAGDFLFPSSMSSHFKGEQMVDLMNGLDGDFNAFDERFFVAFGNHEFDKRGLKYGPMLAQRIEQSGFYWLGSNINLAPAARKSSAEYKKSLIDNKVVTINGVKVGIYGITTDIAVPEYAKIDNDYLTQSKRQIAALKQAGAEVIFAVTHLPISEDEALLKALGDNGPNAVFGGHEHARQHVCVANRCIYKADADARSATIATVNVDAKGKVDIAYRFTILDETTIASDQQLVDRTNQWRQRYQQEYCSKNRQQADCLVQVFGRTDVKLVAEELEIRRFETNLGAFVADQMISAFDKVSLPQGKKVQVSLLNSGSLRLNQNIPALTELNEWYLNAIFQYPVSLRLIEITGAQLQQAVEHGITDWTGNGRYLQVSGMAFRHDVAKQKVTDLSLIGADGKLTKVKPNDIILASVNSYIVDPTIGDQDGYTMLNLDNEIKYGDYIELKDVVRSYIEAKWQQGKGIAPELPGRVCNSERTTLACILDK